MTLISALPRLRVLAALEAAGSFSAAGTALGMSQSVLALDRMVRGSTDVVVVGPRDAKETVALVRAAHRAYLPNRTIAWVDPHDPASIVEAAVLAEGKPAGKGESVAYVCRGRTCSATVSDPAELEKMLREGEKTAA